MLSLIIVIFVAVFILVLQLMGFMILWALLPNICRLFFSGINALLGLLCFLTLEPVVFALAVVFGLGAYFTWEIMPRIMHGSNWRESGVYWSINLPQPKEIPKERSTLRRTKPHDPWEEKRYLRNKE